jgi:GNAT superfamily N-acetyltransferase
VAVQTHRAQSDADLADFHALLVEYEADLPQQLRHGGIPDVTALKQSFSKRSAAFLAAAAGQILGCVAASELDSETALMMRLFVRPASRGLGAARALVLSAIEFVQGAGYTRIVLDTDKELLPAAYRLYRSVGFTECASYASVDYPCPTFMERSVGVNLADDRI